MNAPGPCALCGRAQAAGFASEWTPGEGEKWYCHGDDDPSPTCYEARAGRPVDRGMVTFSHIPETVIEVSAEHLATVKPMRFGCRITCITTDPETGRGYWCDTCPERNSGLVIQLSPWP